MLDARPLRPVVLTMCLLVTLCTPASGQGVGSKEWLEKARRQAGNLSLPPDYYFLAEFRRFANGDEEKLEALRQAIEGKPEHPLRREYIELNRRLNQGPDITREQVWYFDETHWRRNSDLLWETNSRVPWYDTAVNGKQAWRLIPDTITILDPADTEPGYQTDLNEEMAIIAWRYLVSQNITVGPGWTLKETQTNGGLWSAVFESADKKRERSYQGRFLEDGRLFIAKSIMTRSDDEPGWLGAITSFVPDENGLLPEMIQGLQPAISLRREYPTGFRPAEEWTIVKVGTASLEGDRRVLELPKPGADDPIRDLGQLTGLIDRTSRTQFAVDNGTIDRANPISLPTHEKSQSLFDRWGTIVIVSMLSVIIGCLIIVRWKKNS